MKMRCLTVFALILLSISSAASTIRTHDDAIDLDALLAIPLRRENLVHLPLKFLKKIVYEKSLSCGHCNTKEEYIEFLLDNGNALPVPPRSRKRRARVNVPKPDADAAGHHHHDQHTETVTSAAAPAKVDDMQPSVTKKAEQTAEDAAKKKSASHNGGNKAEKEDSAKVKATKSNKDKDKKVAEAPESKVTEPVAAEAVPTVKLSKSKPKKSRSNQDASTGGEHGLAEAGEANFQTIPVDMQPTIDALNAVDSDL